MLSWYQRRFDTVEINNSFYHLPTEETLMAWRRASPPTFCFAVKASRYITHRKKLIELEPARGRFIPQVETLGEHLGPILFQLPPRWLRNLDRLTRFLEALPPAHRYAFEFRDKSWHDAAVFRALSCRNIAFCIYELEGFQSPCEVTADFAYVRLHGPGRKYQGDYSVRALEEWARRVSDWGRSLRAVYVYFDNDQAGYAARNAVELKRMLVPSQPDGTVTENERA
jgi:uncharacterized protein YecE (DUF72 family)